MSKEVIAGSGARLACNVWDISATPAKPKTSGTIYALVRLDKPGDADHGKYWDANSSGAWIAAASVVSWPTMTYSKASGWYYDVPAGATTGKAGGTIALIDATDNVATPASSTVLAGGCQQVDVVAEARLSTTSSIAGLTGNIAGDVQGKVLGGGASSMSAAGVRAVDGAGNAIAPAATAVSSTDYTSARAAKIDALDAAITTRAAASTAVSNADLTPARAAKLDNLDTSISSRLASSGYTAPDNSVINAIGVIVSGALDATISSRATPADVAASESAIRGTDADTLKTLSDQVDDVAQLVAPVGSRSISFVVQGATGVRIGDVAVTLFDRTGTNIVWVGRSAANGETEHLSLNDGTYLIRKAKAGVVFTEPETVTVTRDEDFTIIGEAWVPSAPSDPLLCVVYDWILDAAGQPIVGASIKINAVVPGSAGGHELGKTVIDYTTGEDGYVEFELIRGAKVSIMAPDIGFEDAKKTVPDVASLQLSRW